MRSQSTTKQNINHLSLLCKKTQIKVPAKLTEIPAGSQPVEDLALAPSKITRFLIISASTALSIDCGGPGSFSLAAPPAPEVPLLSKDLAANCAASDSKKSASDRTELELAPATKVGYREKVRAYLATNCVSCHGQDGSAPDLSSYAGAKRAAKASLAAIREDAMPPDKPSSDAEKELFAAWVNGGTQETVAASCDATKKSTKNKNTNDDKDGKDQDNGSKPGTPATIPPPVIGPAPAPGPGPGPGPAPAPAPAPGGTVTYKTVIKPYLDSKCGSCHGRAPVLTSYAAAKSAAVESLNSMKEGRMPPGSRPAQTEINNLQTWINAGYPE